jgi:TOM7 family
LLFPPPPVSTQTAIVKIVRICIMAVPKRRNGGKSSRALSLSSITGTFWKMLDVDFVFQKTKTVILYGFTPFVIYWGINTEPKPHILDLFNIWE